MKNGKTKLKVKNEWRAYLFILPLLFFFVLFLVVPTIQSIFISFLDWDFLTKPKFVGLDNFKNLFTPGTFDSSQFWLSFLNTLIFVLCTVPPIVLLSLIFALMLDKKIPGRNVFRGIFYLPAVLSVSCVALMWVWMFDNDFGILNIYIQKFGLAKVNWLTDMPQAWISLTIVTVWWCVGGNMVLFLAGLADIPVTLYESTRIDGANSFQQFIYITIPCLKRTLLYVLVMTNLAQFNVYGQPAMITGGGPGESTQVLMMYIRNVAFSQFRMGASTAMSLIMGLFLIGFSVLQFKALKPKA